jgi:hypothetical protein
MSKSEVNEAYMKGLGNNLTYDPETQKRTEKKTVRFVDIKEPKEKKTVKETKAETEPNKSTDTTKTETEALTQQNQKLNQMRTMTT